VFTYVGLALALLKFINNLMNYVDREAAMKAGADAEIAKTALAIANKTSAGKAIMEKVNAMSPADVDAELAGLEPK
jgi:hypothetical protein